MPNWELNPCLAGARRVFYHYARSGSMQLWKCDSMNTVPDVLFLSTLCQRYVNVLDSVFLQFPNCQLSLLAEQRFRKPLVTGSSPGRLTFIGARATCLWKIDLGGDRTHVSRMPGGCSTAMPGRNRCHRGIATQQILFPTSCFLTPTP